MKYAISNFRSTVFFKSAVDYIMEAGKPDRRSPDCNRAEQ